jgi:tyrosinase
MKKILIIIVLTISVACVTAQTIRKPWSELTSSEKATYVNAIKGLSSSDVANLANEHDRLFFDGIHDADEFLPWHRIFIGFFEDLVQAQDPNVTLPYWDWWEYSTWTSTSTDLFDNASGGSMGLFGYNIIESGSPWNYDTRTFSFTWSTTPADVDLTETSVTDFSDDLEGEDDGEPHNNGHVFVGGTMDSRSSPGDPVFYLHHCMVDKVWADWFRAHPTSTGNGLNTSMRTFNGYPGFPNTTVDATDYVNPRDLKLWYAYDNVLLLDNYTASGTEVYYYSTGSIEVDDFTIPSTADVEFRTEGQTITIEKDFEVVAGAELLITTDGN